MLAGLGRGDFCAEDFVAHVSVKPIGVKIQSAGLWPRTESFGRFLVPGGNSSVAKTIVRLRAA